MLSKAKKTAAIQREEVRISKLEKQAKALDESMAPFVKKLGIFAGLKTGVFEKDSNRELLLDSEFTAKQRRYIHQKCQDLGL